MQPTMLYVYFALYSCLKCMGILKVEESCQFCRAMKFYNWFSPTVYNLIIWFKLLDSVSTIADMNNHSHLHSFRQEAA